MKLENTSTRSQMKDKEVEAYVDFLVQQGYELSAAKSEIAWIRQQPLGVVSRIIHNAEIISEYIANVG